MPAHERLGTDHGDDLQHRRKPSIQLDEDQAIAVAEADLGMVRLASCKARTMEAAVPKITSGDNPTSSAAYLRKRSVSPEPHRSSMRMLLPISQPNCCRP